MNDGREKFSELLRRLRTRYNRTKAYITRSLGTSESYLINVESGIKPAPNYQTCMKIAVSLGLTDSETKELIDAARRERFDEKDWGFFESFALDAYKEEIKKRYGHHFANPEEAAMWADERAENCIRAINSLPSNKCDEAYKMIALIIRGLSEGRA